ncbi:MAG: hypothetical protein WCG66_09000 [bacterium]
MNTAIAWICGLWTAGGAFLLFREAGSCSWWDAGWVLLLALMAHVSLVMVGGLSRARLCAGVVLVVFASMVLLTALCGWPLGPLRFTGPAALRLGNVFPLLPPLMAFSLLTLSQRALAVACPEFGTNALAVAVAAVFTASILNAASFLSRFRIWWLWNPWGETQAPLATISGSISLVLAGFFLARIYPEDTGLKLSRWSPALAVLIVLNLLFLAANTLHFVRSL